MLHRTFVIAVALAAALALASCAPIEIPSPYAQDGVDDTAVPDTADPGTGDPAADDTGDIAKPDTATDVVPDATPDTAPDALPETTDDVGPDTTTCTTGLLPCPDGQCHACCYDTDCQKQGMAACKDYSCYGVYDPCQGTCGSAAPYCVDVNGVPSCVECIADTQCTATGYCDPTAHNCAPKPECATDADCVYSACTCSGGTCVIGSGTAIMLCKQTCQAACQVQLGCAAAIDPNTGWQWGPDCRNGYCVDPKGACDPTGQMACCGIGQACDGPKVFGINTTGLPSGTVPPGVCTCKTAADCINGQPCNATKLICKINPALCINGTTPPLNWPSGICYDLKALANPTGL